MILPKTLYHYTSQNGLLGILNTGKLWMTNIRYLNDSSEFKYTLDLVKSELEKGKKLLLSKRGVVGLSLDKGIEGETFKIYELLEGLLNYSYYDDRREIPELYVFSLSEKPDDLNQWRGYCPSEGGFCIEFDTNKLEDIILNKNHYEIDNCKYCKKDDSLEIRNLVEPFFLRLNTLLESSDIGYTGVFRGLLLDINRISPYIKDFSFHSESEIRIIYRGENNIIKYREGKSMVIPYTEGDLLDDVNKLPINKIIIGPTPHKILSKISVINLLISKGYPGEVESSEIPYRSW